MDTLAFPSYPGSVPARNSPGADSIDPRERWNTMYSLLMMTAMAGSPDAAAFGGRLFGNGCSGGCTGVVYSSCGGCYGSCTGAACYGGSYYSACTGSYFSSCLGYGQSTYYTGSYSCGGGYGTAYYSVYGGCYGSCFGTGFGYHVAPIFAPPLFTPACCAPACYAPVVGCMGYGVPGVIVGSAPGVAGAADGVIASRPDGGTNGLLANAPADAAAPARLSIELPAGAKLYVDGRLTTGAGDKRQFHTPELVRGKAFYYDLRAEVEVNGAVEVEEKKVVVRAGETLTEAFPKLLAAARTAAGPAVAAK